MLKTIVSSLILLVSTVVLAAQVSVSFTIVPTMQYTDGTAIPAGTPITYNLYGQECSKPLPLPLIVSGKTQPLVNYKPDITEDWCYGVTEVVNNQESGLSNILRFSPPVVVHTPSPPTISK